MPAMIAPSMAWKPRVAEMARVLVEKGRRAIVAAGELMETEKRSA